MKHWPKRGLSFLNLIFISLFLILIISLISLFYFNQKERESEDQDVKFWFYRHAEQEAGEENTFFIFIKNQEKRDLERAEVILKFPQGFVLNSSSPACDQSLNQGCLWSLDKIEKGELKEIKITGRLFGQSEQDQMFTGNLNFYLSGFSSSFQKSLSSSVMLKPSILLTWQMPEQSSFGQSIKSTISLENISQEILPKTELTLNWPKNFVLKDIKSIPANDDLVKWEINDSQRWFKWKIEDLNIKNQKGLEFEGFLTNPSINELDFNLQAGVFYEDKFFLQTEKEKKVFLEKFEFNVFLEANNSVKDNQIVTWGDVVPIELIFKNQSQQSIQDLILDLKLTGGQYLNTGQLYQTDWHYYQGAAQDSPEFISEKVLKNTISDSITYSPNENSGWNSGTIPVFKQIKPGEEGVIVFDLPIKNSLEAAKNNYSQASIELQVIARGKLGGDETSWSVFGNKINLLLETNVILESSARYYDEEHVIIGGGPLPPQVGEKTYFWIFWGIKNTTNPLKNVTVKTKLPVNVSWTGKTKTSHGLILYEEKNRGVGWDIPFIDIYQGGPYSLLEAGFEVEVVPKFDQLNKIIPLTENIFFTGQDGFTHESVLLQDDFLDTNLSEDFWGKNRGTVEEKEE